MTVKASPGTHVPQGVLEHTAFLERASQPGNAERAHALGAFLALRAVDRVAMTRRSVLNDGLAFQLRSASEYLDDLKPQTKEVSHLREIIRVAQRGLQTRNRSLLWGPLLAFAYWLENEMRLDESLDVIESAFKLRDGSPSEHEIAACLQQGRVLRLSGRFAEARAAYSNGGDLATLFGDYRSFQVSRIGRAAVTVKTGDLPAAERELREVLRGAEESGDVFVQARARHDLAVVIFHAGRCAEAVPLAFHAFELYEEPNQQARALADLGVFLKDLGHYSAAREACLEVLGRTINADVRINMALELLELSATIQDRLGFERWRKELASRSEKLPLEQEMEFEMKLGSGLAEFGNLREAKSHLARAVALAQEGKLGQRIFQAEALLAALNDEARVPDRTRAVAEEHSVDFAVQDAIEGVYALRSGA